MQKELQIKCAQGAKPGEGGQLPGKKYTLKSGEARHPLQALNSYLHHHIMIFTPSKTWQS